MLREAAGVGWEKPSQAEVGRQRWASRPPSQRPLASLEQKMEEGPVRDFCCGPAWAGFSLLPHPCVPSFKSGGSWEWGELARALPPSCFPPVWGGRRSGGTEAARLNQDGALVFGSSVWLSSAWTRHLAPGLAHPLPLIPPSPFGGPQPPRNVARAPGICAWGLPWYRGRGLCTSPVGMGHRAPPLRMGTGPGGGLTRWCNPTSQERS